MKTVVSLVVVFFLAGCATYPAVHSPPPYVVRLVSSTGTSACTGVLVDRVHVLTAEHCSGNKTFVSNQYGQTSRILYVAHADRDLDLAVLFLESPLYSPYWATFAEPKKALPAFLYGNCPIHWQSTARAATWAGTDGDYDVWVVDGCGGDSGGPFVQGTHVVGVLQRVRGSRLLDATNRGTEAHARPPGAVVGFLEDLGLCCE